MSWAGGSYLAEEVWNVVRPLVPAQKRRAAAREIIELFEDEDCDTIDEAGELCKDAGREYDEDAGEVVYRD